MGTDLLRVQSNERVDITDFEFISQSVQAHERQQFDNFLGDPGRTRKWILSGFDMSNPAGTQIRVTKGKAILAKRMSGTVQYGLLTTEGDATITVDLNAYAPGTYGVYIRFEEIAGDAESRIFWDPTGAGSEFAQTINTRLTAGWSMRVESSTPGDDWLYIGDVTAPGMAITKKREFYFEGAEDSSFESGWSSEGGGVVNDRNVSRETYGVTDLQMFTAAMRQCIVDIRGRGLKEWFEQGIGGMNIGFDTDPTATVLNVGDVDFGLDLSGAQPQINWGSDDYLQFSRALSRFNFHINGSDRFYMDTGSFSPAADDSGALGAGGAAWASVRAYTLTLETGGLGEGVASALLPTADDTYDLGVVGQAWQDLFLSGSANVAIDVLVDQGLRVGSGVTNPAAGDGIFSNGLVVGFDGAPIVDQIHLGAATSGLFWTNAITLMELRATANCKIWLDGSIDEMSLFLGGASVLKWTSAIIQPALDLAIALGDATHRLTNLFSDTLRLDNTGDPGSGTAAHLTFTGFSLFGSAGNGSIGPAGGNANAGFIKLYQNAATPWYIPYWTAIA